MRISDWSSDVCSSDLYPSIIFDTGYLGRRQDNWGRGAPTGRIGTDPRTLSGTMGTNESVRFVRSAKVTGVIPCQRRGCAAKREDDDDDSTGTSPSNLDPAGVRGLARRAGGFAGPCAGSGRDGREQP